MDDGHGDWRIGWSARMTNSLPAAFPGGPSHEPGSIVQLCSLTRDRSGTAIGFVTPSAVALAISIAIRTSAQARQQKSLIRFGDVLTPFGPGNDVQTSDLAGLYDYFECCMAAAVFSFQSIEAFCNWEISLHLKGKFKLQRKKGIEEVGTEELQRKASTDEKVATVLPLLLGVTNPKGSKLWQDFVTLKQVRDSTTHMKAHDQYTDRIDEESLLFQFFNHDAAEYPQTAISVMKYFARQPLRWLEAAEQELSKL